MAFLLRLSLMAFFLSILYLSNTFADRLIRRSDGEIFLLGLGIPDAKKETVLFRSCNDQNSKLFSLKDYLFQSGKDCGLPKIFSGVESIRIDGTNEPHKFEKCSTGKSCLRYIVNSPEAVETVFSGAKSGDKIEVTISDFDKSKVGTNSRNVNLIMRFIPEKSGEVKNSLTFSKVPASGSFVNKVMDEPPK